MKAIIALLVLISVGGATAQFARAGEFSIGLMAGQATFDEINTICNDVRQQGPEYFVVRCTNPDDSDSALGINAAFHFNDSWAIEAGYVDLGEYVTRLSVLRESADITLSAESLYLAGVGTVPLSQRFSLSGRAGVYEARGEVGVVSAFDAVEIDGDAEFYAGASVDFRVTDKLALQVRYDAFDEIKLIAAGVQFRF
ncbi:outer membrane beta-barrel protein [Arenicella xantha]|uniref:Outer membrane protein with beta-barrel domain n=1 Tax=Arenicella xantha TaxID=644221 RepID=A0A395JNG7_9GAMM|nr:outer membrane beta-barrel protein [Arenicella xantha]RBP51337.1 outer membrane protein with beta-barrel domain [Arenicella xantha]